MARRLFSRVIAAWSSTTGHHRSEKSTGHLF
jgi:hypothetical protein